MIITVFGPQSIFPPHEKEATMKGHRLLLPALLIAALAGPRAG